MERLMHNDLRDVHRHMLNLGLGALTHANWHANYFSQENPLWGELSVLQAAHACEILIKARIAQEHPLLIFEEVPKASSDDSLLTLRQLVENGKTHAFVNLPDRLWAATGTRLPGIARYKTFGKLRNAIQHFKAPDDVDVSYEAVRFIYEVIDPFIHDCWGLYAIDFNEDHEPHIYLVEGLIRKGVLFLVSPEMMDVFEWITLEWPEGKRAYRKTMEARFESARKELEELR